MNLLVIRHARAESARDFAATGASDDLRPLTEDGKARMRLGAAGLHRLVRDLDVLASSPLVRSRETADIVAAEYDLPHVLELDALRPDAAVADFGAWVRDAGAEETIAIVGHDTHLSELVGWLLTGRTEQIVRIRKGAAVMLELQARGLRRPGPRSGTLLWALTPRALRMLGGEEDGSPNVVSATDVD